MNVADKSDSEIEGGQVKGGTHLLNPLLLTCKWGDGGERSAANKIN